MDWKKKMSKPSKRKQVWSVKENRWLDPEEEAALMKMLAEKQAKLKELCGDKTPEQVLTEEFLKSGEDEPEGEPVEGLAQQMLDGMVTAKSEPNNVFVHPDHLAQIEKHLEE